MVSPTLVRRFATGALLGLLAVGVIAGSPPQNPAADRPALSAFEKRVGAYAALHRRLEGPLPPSKSSMSTRSFLLARVYLAAAIKAARPNARQGDIFTPAVADLFRHGIAEALDERDTKALLRDLYGEHEMTQDFHPRVYDPYPDWAAHEMPSILLQWLPPLPEDIEYRLVDHDLVLWDIHADLIVDFLPDAIPRSSS